MLLRGRMPWILLGAGILSASLQAQTRLGIFPGGKNPEFPLYIDFEVHPKKLKFEKVRTFYSTEYDHIVSTSKARLKALWSKEEEDPSFRAQAAKDELKMKNLKLEIMEWEALGEIVAMAPSVPQGDPFMGGFLGKVMEAIRCLDDPEAERVLGAKAWVVENVIQDAPTVKPFEARRPGIWKQIIASKIISRRQEATELWAKYGKMVEEVRGLQHKLKGLLPGTQVRVFQTKHQKPRTVVVETEEKKFIRYRLCDLMTDSTGKTTFPEYQNFVPRKALSSTSRLWNPPLHWKMERDEAAKIECFLFLGDFFFYLDSSIDDVLKGDERMHETLRFAWEMLPTFVGLSVFGIYAHFLRAMFQQWRAVSILRGSTTGLQALLKGVDPAQLAMVEHKLFFERPLTQVLFEDILLTSPAIPASAQISSAISNFKSREQDSLFAANPVIDRLSQTHALREEENKYEQSEKPLYKKDSWWVSLLPRYWAISEKDTDLEVLQGKSDGFMVGQYFIRWPGKRVDLAFVAKKIERLLTPKFIKKVRPIQTRYLDYKDNVTVQTDPVDLCPNCVELHAHPAGMVGTVKQYPHEDFPFVSD